MYDSPVSESKVKQNWWKHFPLTFANLLLLGYLLFRFFFIVSFCFWRFFVTNFCDELLWQIIVTNFLIQIYPVTSNDSYKIQQSSMWYVGLLGRWNERLIDQAFDHTASLETIFVQAYMDALPGVSGVSKIRFFFQIKLFQWYREPEKLH